MKRMVLSQYAKKPLLGKVKTRIAKDLGDERALEIHMQLVQELVAKFSADDQFDYQLWLAEPLDCIEELDPSSINQIETLKKTVDIHTVNCKVQSGDTLGERMANTFATLSNDYEHIAIIGSDCPNVSAEDLHKVNEVLFSSDVVIIPAEDGGYVLIAMRAEAIRVLPVSWLSNVSWGGQHVLEQTLNRCSEYGLSSHLFQESWDVDELDDYKRWISLKNDI